MAYRRSYMIKSVKLSCCFYCLVSHCLIYVHIPLFLCTLHLESLHCIQIHQDNHSLLKVARYSLPEAMPPKFENKLRRHKQSFEKIATTVVLDKDENLLWSGLQWYWSCHSNEMTLSPILLSAVYIGTGTVLSKSFTEAFSSNNRLDVREV